MTRRLWVFLVTGGTPFEMQVHGNPIMSHDGGRSILRSLCTDAQVADIEETMRRHGCSVTSSCPSESAEQRAERGHVLAIMGADRPFPTARCPECAWFDAQVESLCGAGVTPEGEGWDDSVVESAMATAKHRADFEACPLRQEVPR
jgi:hypothetical protein